VESGDSIIVAKKVVSFANRVVLAVTTARVLSAMNAGAVALIIVTTIVESFANRVVLAVTTVRVLRAMDAGAVALTIVTMVVGSFARDAAMVVIIVGEIEPPSHPIKEPGTICFGRLKYLSLIAIRGNIRGASSQLLDHN
jgi:hypothetical protein